MGNKIIKILDIAVLAASIAFFVYVGYPITHKALSSYKIDYYEYKPAEPVVSRVDASKLRPAKAVPILMYHGVLKEKEDTNTSIDNFVAQMEMLKREGYQTISIKEYDLFRQGKFTLPPKPVIITFDDGRKDSYYTTDDIFRKLGFKATIFVASEKAIENEPFYLTWNDLRTMRDSGRWEIEAHGRRSHEKVAISRAGIDKEYGRYLTSKMYLAESNRLETDAEFEKRVEQDYVNNISDLKTQLGITPQYLAIPLNDYGQTPVSNNPTAAKFNQSIIKNYFRMAFIEANSSEDVASVALPIYNYKNDDPYRLRRLEVKNMTPATLKYLLDREMPTTPDLYLSPANLSDFNNHSRLEYGYMSTGKDGLRLRTLKANATAKVLFGDAFWDDYDVGAQLDRHGSRSVSLIAYAKDEDNHIEFGVTDNSLFLRERKGGAMSDLRPPILYEKQQLSGFHEYKIVQRAGKITAYFDGTPVFTNVSIGLAEGSPGVKTWSETGRADVTVRSVKISPSARS